MTSSFNGLAFIKLEALIILNPIISLISPKSINTPPSASIVSTTIPDGSKIDNPRFIKADEKALAKAQWKLSKQAKGTPPRKKAMKVVFRVYERIANNRDDFVQKVNRNLVNSYGTISFEDLNINSMVENHCLTKSIMDCAWSKLVQYISYKAESVGRRVALVDPNGTSQMCF